ncbi:MAG: DUF433 domain-containing protein [Ignavibacteriae bacterium]|nr:DUF433 domain-containing protein [Ignavibacteriota bacterium]
MMTEVLVENRYIALKPETNEPIIKGTGVTVRAIAEHWLMGAQPEEILLHIPHLTLAQIFDALSYYDDNKEVIEGFIEINKIPEELSGTRLSR